MRRLLLAPLAVVVLAAGGCGDDSAETASTPSDAAPVVGAPATPTPSEGGVEVGMEGLRFGPDTITVKTGTTITWKNNEDIPHNVVAEEGADFASDTFGRNGTFAFEAAEPGTIAYVCTLHPGMEGSITVEG